MSEGLERQALPGAKARPLSWRIHLGHFDRSMAEGCLHLPNRVAAVQFSGPFAGPGA